MHTSSVGSQSKIEPLALAFVCVTLWLLMRGYHGLTADAQIYAFQALARLHPQLTADLYLQNTSQDQFTIFSPFYAGCIGVVGLENAARMLTVLFTLWLLSAVWSIARAVTGRDAAWLAVAFLLIVAGEYGGSGVFRISEQYLTARLPAEALIVTAVACCSHGRNRLGFLLATGAMLVHPLIALPGMLLLICLSLPARAALLGAAGGLLVTFVIALVSSFRPWGLPGLTVMDPAWADIVRERSQFLFLPLWSVRDWELNTQPFLYLGFTAIAVPDRRIRKLCAAAALVGSVGLAVAWTGSIIGPVAILVQGQAWRWVWITVFVSALLLPGTALHVWRHKCGPLCVLLLVAGWTLPTEAGTACVSLALLVWVMRSHVEGRAAYFRWAAALFGVAIMVWVVRKSWLIAAGAAASTPWGAPVRDIFGLRVPALMFGALAWWCVRSSRTDWVPLCLTVLLAALSIVAWPAAFKQSHTYGSAKDAEEFSDWIGAIPPASTVLVTPARDVGAFVWFTLQRPNYLAVDQSAGVVFSRATAMEVQRRSLALLPLMDPNWKIMTSLRAAAAGHKADAAARPLTAEILRQVCADPKLGFVISPVDLRLPGVRHDQTGAWKDWHLYDCGKVGLALPAT